MTFKGHIFNPAIEEMADAMSIRFNQMVYDKKRAGQDVIVLSLGEAFFKIPLFDFNVLDYEKGYHYSDSQGLPDLRNRIANYYHQHYGVTVNGSTEILLSAGSKPIIFMSMLAVLQPGEEVMVHEPCWLSYPHQARMCGAKTRFVPYNVAVRDFEKMITPRTRMIILNNPNNPAGYLYSQEDLSFLYKVCVEKQIYLLVDEAYSDFVLDGSFVSIGRISEDKRYMIIVNSLSKNMGMSGWRIGYAIGHPEFIQTVLKINQHMITCAPTILLQYCARYFDDILSHTLPQVQEVVKKRARVSEMIEALDLKVLPGSTTFYFFVSLGNYPSTSLDFATKLLNDHGVCVVPGSAYGQSTDRFVRVSIGAESEERILEGLKRLKHVSEHSKSTGVVFTSEQD